MTAASMPSIAHPPALRILYVIGSMGIGGAEQHLRLVSHHLTLRGFNCEVFALDPEGPLRALFEQSGVPVRGVSLPAGLKRALPYPRLLARIRLCLAAPALLWHYWRRRPDIVHFFLPAAYCVGAVLALLAPRMKRVMSRRSLNNYRHKHQFIHAVEKHLHKHMDAICGNSKAVVSQLADEGVSRDRLRLIFNGVDLSRFTNIRKTKQETRLALGISPDALVFIIVANLIPYKGHHDLINALSSINSDLPADWVCLCVGRDDGIRVQLQAQANERGIGENFMLLGSRHDIPELMACSDVGVLCSHEEGFSNAVLEAMAAGLPMVVTDVGGNAEAVQDGDTGYVVAAGNSAAIANALLKIARDPNRRAMGERGRYRVTANFSMSACINAYQNLYGEPARATPDVDVHT
jgi:glycosyltransferase involved in cell wall biosynthesis